MDDLRGMTVRELIIALSEVEDEIRRTRLGPPLPSAAVAGPASDALLMGAVEPSVAERLMELGLREKRIVDELQTRRTTG
jgi:hypothetical protein